LSKAPPQAKNWPLSFDISLELCSSYGMAYSPSMNRVLLPIYREGKLVSYQARRLTGNGPKYLSKGERGEFYLLLDGAKHKASLVICEDYLSAIKVNSLGYSSLALLTTSIPDRVLLNLVKAKYKRVFLWLDSDNVSVRRKERELYRQLESLLGKGVLTYVMLTDPKKLPYGELESLLQSTYLPVLSTGRTIQ
jgi:hypothetical protein